MIYNARRRLANKKALLVPWLGRPPTEHLLAIPETSGLWACKFAADIGYKMLHKDNVMESVMPTITALCCTYCIGLPSLLWEPLSLCHKGSKLLYLQ